MKPNIIHSITVCLAAFPLLFMVACASQDESLPEEISEAILYLNIEPVGLSRAGTATLPDNESMHSVRVIVLHSDGTVEHNKFYSLHGAEEQKLILLKVTPDEKKKVYLFANEESISSVEDEAGVNRSSLSEFFDSYGEKVSGFETAVNGLCFAPDYSEGKPIPMSSLYEIDFPVKGNFEGTFYVVRVATKFTMNFRNWRGEKVTVTDFTIASHADKNYLMAHVDDSPRNRQLFQGKTWINWLKGVSEASSANDNYATTEAAGWLKDYQLPPTADRTRTYTYGTTVTVGLPAVDIVNPDNSRPGVADHLPVFYLPESMNPKAGATDGEQEYTLTIRIAGRDEPFVCPLPNLKALFRNTHVVLDIALYNSLEIEVNVIPYSEVDLDPEFGLDDINKRNK